MYFREKLVKEEAERLERSDTTMNLIILSVGDHVLRKIELCTSGASSWFTLEMFYLSKTLPNIIHLEHKLYIFKMVDTQDMDENIDGSCVLPVKRECSYVRGGARRLCC